MLILAAAYLGPESVRIKCTQALSAASSSRGRLLRMHWFCYCSPEFLLLPSIRLRKMASASNESRITKEKDSPKKRVWSALKKKKLLTICSGIEIAEKLGHCVTSASVSSASTPQVFVYDFTGSILD